MQDKSTHFGYQTVKESEKEGRVHEVFHNVADTYDVMNDVMSAGIHRVWKDKFMEVLGPTFNTKLVDVAGGTGDIAFRFLDYNNNKSEHLSTPSPQDSDEDTEDIPSRSVTIVDINQAMLDVGKSRAEKCGRHHGIEWILGNAECLPLKDEQYDAYTIAFGIRNCTHIDKVLEDAYRVLKPGGRFLCLEFSNVDNTILRSLYDYYSFQVIPVMGEIIAKDWNSYQYLVESIRKFPKQIEFASMIEEAGFREVSYENLLFGVAAIHSGYKI